MVYLVQALLILVIMLVAARMSLAQKHSTSSQLRMLDCVVGRSADEPGRHDADPNAGKAQSSTRARICTPVSTARFPVLLL